MSREIPIVPIELDKPRNIKLTGRAFMNIEEYTGKNCFQGELWETLSTKDLLITLWQGLLHEDPSLTLEQVADMYHPGVMVDVMEALEKAWVSAVDLEKLEARADKDMGKLTRFQRPERPGG